MEVVMNCRLVVVVMNFRLFLIGFTTYLAVFLTILIRGGEALGTRRPAALTLVSVLVTILVTVLVAVLVTVFVRGREALGTRRPIALAFVTVFVRAGIALATGGLMTQIIFTPSS